MKSRLLLLFLLAGLLATTLTALAQDNDSIVIPNEASITQVEISETPIRISFESVGFFGICTDDSEITRIVVEGDLGYNNLIHSPAAECSDITLVNDGTEVFLTTQFTNEEMEVKLIFIPTSDPEDSKELDKNEISQFNPETNELFVMRRIATEERPFESEQTIGFLI